MSVPDQAAAHADHNTALPLSSFVGVVPENATELAEAHTSYDAALPAAPAGELVRVQMTLKDMTVEIAPGVEYNTWAFDGHGAPGPIIHVREGQTVEMTLTNGGSIPHSIDFHAARIAPNVAFRGRGTRRLDQVPIHRVRSRHLHVPLWHQAGARPHRQRNVRRDRRSAEGSSPTCGQRVRTRRQRVVPERRRDRGAGVARHGQSASSYG